MKKINNAMKIIVVATFWLFFLNLSVAQTSNDIQDAINDFVDHQELKNAAVSFAAYDIVGDSLIANHNDNIAIPPASTVKLFTTATAFETLGANYQPKTRFYYRGEIDTCGVLKGDLIIRGGGDPTLGSKYFTDEENHQDFLEEWSKFVESAGIKSIDGNIITDASAFGYQGAPDGWSWSDMGNYYGAGPSGLVIYDNMTRLHFSTSSGLDQPTQLDSMTPHIDGYNLLNTVTTYNSSRDNCYIYGAPFTYDRFAVGNLPRNRSNFEVKASVPDPELLTAQEFYSSLLKDSISITGKAQGLRELTKFGFEPIDYDNCTLVGTYKDKSIQDIAFWTNMRSVNLFAEQLLTLVAYEKTKLGSTENGANYINSYWEPRLNIEMFQTDGSGLSRSNGFSAQHYVRLLNYMSDSDQFENYKATLPVAGKSGTLRGVCRGQHASGRIHAKSGTMNRIKSYAGYVESSSGKKIAFALIVNNDNLSNYNLIKRMEVVFNTMAQF
jgi:D-alanyl-D-alanine carboxypeptidase/D-alanyl-D-alanine-endopeptidase (penicillin-binding protein 4)